MILASEPPSRRRLSACVWRSLAVTERRIYQDVYRRLVEEDGHRPTHADSACNYLCHFALICNGDGSADPQQIMGNKDGLKQAQNVWEGMVALAKWNPRHAARARRRLGSALRHVAPPMAYVINPRLRPAGPTVAYSVDRSQQRHFTLHACLPRRVTALGPDHPDYQLLARLVDELANHLRSVSRAHLQHISGFLDGLIFNQDVTTIFTPLGFSFFLFVQFVIDIAFPNPFGFFYT